MAREVILDLSSDEEFELMVLHFWATGKDIWNKFPQERIASVPGLQEAIDAVEDLPDHIGWGKGVEEQLDIVEPSKKPH